MYYHIHQVVLALLVVLLISLWRMLRKKMVKTHPFKFMLFVCLGILCLLFTITPFDAVFYRADNPEKIFSYISSNTALESIYGNNSCMIVSVDHTGSYESIYISQDEKGYRIPQTNTSKRVFSALPGYPSFDIVHISGTSDYYLSGIGAYSTDTLTVTDSLGSQFYIINATSEDGIENETVIYLYYAHLDSFDENYCITIDGQSFCVGDIEQDAPVSNLSPSTCISQNP